MKSKLLFAVWTAAVLAFLVTLGRTHRTPLPPPEAGVPTVAASSSWRVVHLLAADCACSQNVAGYLVRRGPLGGGQTREEVVILGEAPALASWLRQAGWTVSTAAPGTPATYGVKGGPWLLVFDPSGRARYSGGYLGREILDSREPFQDVSLLARLRKGEDLVPYGPFGCPVGWRTTARND